MLKGIPSCRPFEDENAQTSLEHRTPSIKDFNTQEVQRDTIPSRRVLVTDTASKMCALLIA
jgi:hypothetical protein